MKINQVYWDPEIPMLYIILPDITLNIFFRPVYLGNKWLGCKKISCIYKNESLESWMMGMTGKPPIRDIPRFIKNIIKNFPATLENSDKGTIEWIKKKTTKE